MARLSLVSPVPPAAPAWLVVVVGTGTEVGKTWVSCRLLERWRARGLTVAARKPAQSFEEGDDARGTTDADLLAAASGEQPHAVCPAHRWYPVPMAPPMAAHVLGQGTILLDDLLGELTWSAPVTVGLVEAAGGVRSPISVDADGADLARRLDPDRVLLVADADLGVINAVRASAEPLEPLPYVVFLNRYDASNRLHRLNREWLAIQYGFEVHTSLDELAGAVGPRILS